MQLELGRDIDRLFQQSQVYKNLILTETVIHNADLRTRFQENRWGIVLCDVLKLLLAVSHAILT